MEMTTPCNQDCHCNYVKYSPVCTSDGRTFISPCHAGCKDYRLLADGTKVLYIVIWAKFICKYVKEKGWKNRKEKAWLDVLCVKSEG